MLRQVPMTSSGSAVSALTLPKSGVSDAARYLVVQGKRAEEERENSEALFGPVSALISELHRLQDECSEPDWDGYGALPMSKTGAARAEAFIRALPTGIDLPELAPEPDGAVSLDWSPSKSRLFTLSVGPHSMLAYAWIDGLERGHAIAPF